mmetsp:Transcript_50241/g.114100  ORF Transcript_50241/g.114100 Transcript_50241/m.114100 type:complete len:248 (-) Transcript_50241:107-850(-)
MHRGCTLPHSRVYRPCPCQDRGHDIHKSQPRSSMGLQGTRLRSPTHRPRPCPRHALRSRKPQPASSCCLPDIDRGNQAPRHCHCLCQPRCTRTNPPRASCCPSDTCLQGTRCGCWRSADWTLPQTRTACTPQARRDRCTCRLHCTLGTRAGQKKPCPNRTSRSTSTCTRRCCTPPSRQTPHTIPHDEQVPSSDTHHELRSSSRIHLGIPSCPSAKSCSPADTCPLGMQATPRYKHRPQNTRPHSHPP